MTPTDIERKIMILTDSCQAALQKLLQDSREYKLYKTYKGVNYTIHTIPRKQNTSISAELSHLLILFHRDNKVNSLFKSSYYRVEDTYVA